MEKQLIDFVPGWLKSLLKRSETIVALYRKIYWRSQPFQAWWGTVVWKKTTEVTTPFGFKFVSGFHAAYREMREGVYEIDEANLIGRLLASIDVFIDVGANLGYYTCLASSHGKKVIAFEPQPQNLSCLRRNLVVNGFQELVEIFPLALSEIPGVQTLYGASGPAASLIKGWAGLSPGYRQSVPVSTLDHVLGMRFMDQQLLVKIDVEGAEYQVLSGARATLGRAKQPIWMVEICMQDEHPLGFNPNFKKTFDLFFRLGYQAYTATIPPRPVTRDDVDIWVQRNSTGSGEINYIFASAQIAQANFSI